MPYPRYSIIKILPEFKADADYVRASMIGRAKRHLTHGEAQREVAKLLRELDANQSNERERKSTIHDDMVPRYGR
jgi:hypothetical protein